MPAIITRGLPEDYYLLDLDPSGETHVTIQPATVAHNAQRDELWARQTRTYNADSPKAVSVTSESTWSQRQALEVFLTMLDCNIEFQEVNPEGEPVGDPKPMFRIGRKGNAPFLDMSRDKFAEAWGLLTQDAANEIHGKVLEKNPQWDPFREVE